MKVRIGVLPEASGIKIAMIIEFFFTGFVVLDLVLIVGFISHSTSIIRTLIDGKTNKVNYVKWSILLSLLLKNQFQINNPKQNIFF